MASHQLPLLCAPLGLLLLLLIGVISSYMPEVHAAPIDFWRNARSRKSIMERIQMKAGCEGSDALPSAAEVPCVDLNMEKWINTTLKQKFAEVLESLRKFQKAVKDLKNQITGQCQSFVEDLERNISNHEEIVSNRQRELFSQNDNSGSSDFLVPICPQTTLDNVLEEYKRLLRGKVDRLAKAQNNGPGD